MQQIILYILQILIGFFIFGQASYAQEDLSEKDVKTVVDEPPYISVRAAGMAGALSSLADGLHAPYYNPAGIGGIHWGRNRPPFVRHLSFPFVGGAANENSTKLSQEFDRANAGTDRAIGKAVIDASAGKRQYARGSGLFTLGLGRTLFLHSIDSQLAAFKKEGGSIDSGSISAAYRSQSSTGFGFSVVDEKEQVYLGAFSSLMTRTNFSGDLTYDQIIAKEDRSEVIDSRSAVYQGGSTNYGGIFVLGKEYKPTLGIAIRQAGGTRLSRIKEPSDQSLITPSDIKIEEDLTVGFSISPSLGKNNYFNFIVEGTQLTSEELAVNKKFRTGLELNLGGFGSEATMGARAGYNLAGVSYGLSFNFKLVQLEFASQAEDIGIDNRHVVERRNMAVFSVNVTDD